MIKTYADKQTKKLVSDGKSKYFPQMIVIRALIKLGLLPTATTVEDLRLPPSNHLETLSGDRVGQYSIRINNQYRIYFNFENGNAFDVEIVDYH
jgi:proteic killer suppression protein